MKCRYDSHQYLKLFVICFLVFLAILSIWHNTDAYASDTSKILISEICAKNTTISTSDGQYYDWIELYNDND